jgi:glucose-6-phosphate isomerase
VPTPLSLGAAESCESLWNRYRRYRCDASAVGLSLDVSRVRFDDELLARMAGPLDAALDAMDALEAGAVANPDEGRMVGHYWLRAPQLAPTAAIDAEIQGGVNAVRAFAEAVHRGEVHGAGGPFEDLIHIGIGGSAVGPQLLSDALGGDGARMRVHFLDNVDPDGVERLLSRLRGRLDRTLVALVSKSGVTPTPLHVGAVVRTAYKDAGIDFAKHAVATTMRGTPLDRRARDEGWLVRFPLWEWVGGRTSGTSAVGLLPAALQGIDIDALLDGAGEMDRLTRARDVLANPAALLALSWHWLGHGTGSRRMVLLPYRDRLALLPGYVQQLVMESVGKERDRSGAIVHQGLTVYGHKGSSDQHAYVQQLRDGTNDFFVTFVCTLRDGCAGSVEVTPGLTLGDYLFANFEGTRDALYRRGRDSITIVLDELSPRSLGALVALYERAVGLYAELIDVNAYHQPGVDKEAASEVVALQREVVAVLRERGTSCDAEEIAVAIGRPDRAETIHRLLERLSTDPGRAGAAEAVTVT